MLLDGAESRASSSIADSSCSNGTTTAANPAARNEAAIVEPAVWSADRTSQRPSRVGAAAWPLGRADSSQSSL